MPALADEARVAADLPSLTAPPTAAQQAVAAEQNAIEGLASRRQAAVEASLDIRDPSVTVAEPEKEATPSPAPPKKPATLPGADSSPSTPSFSSDLLKRALEAGIDTDEARAFGTPENLERAVGLVYRNLARYGPHDKPAPAPETPTEPAVEFPKLDPTQYSPEFITAWEGQQKAFLAHLDKRDQIIKAQTEQLQQITQGNQEQQANSARTTVDEFISGLAEDAIYGKGSRYEVADTSAEFQSRIKLCRRAESIEREYKEDGKTVPPLRQLLSEAHESLHGRRVAESQTQTRLKDAETGRFIARPTAKASPSLKKGEELAVSNLTKFMAEKGMLYGTSPVESGAP